jgi:hypothetical protein
VTMWMPSRAISRRDGRRVAVRAELADDHLVRFLPIGSEIRKRDIGGFIAVFVRSWSITAIKDIIRDVVEGTGRQTFGNVG